MDFLNSLWFAPFMLLCSNVFMTFAWYGHLKYKHSPLWIVIAVSWSIALLEYIFQVPANRYGSNVFAPAQLKTIQEIISLSVFAVFSGYYIADPVRWNYIVEFFLIILAAFFIFGFKKT